MLYARKYTFDDKTINDFSDFQFISSWEINYKSWKNNTSIPVKFIRYEDLSEKTFTVFQDIVNFIDKNSGLKKKFDKDKAKKAISSTSFEKLKNLEKKKGFLESMISKKNKKRIPFFYQGPKNNWKINFDEKFKIKINEVFKNDIKQLNY